VVTLKSGWVDGQAVPAVADAPGLVVTDAPTASPWRPCAPAHPGCKARTQGIAALAIHASNHFAVVWPDTEPFAAEGSSPWRWSTAWRVNRREFRLRGAEYPAAQILKAGQAVILIDPLRVPGSRYFKRIEALFAANAVKMGRKPKLTPHQEKEAIKRRDRGDETLAEIGRSYSVSLATISRLHGEQGP
jgi:hypothetical protein